MKKQTTSRQLSLGEGTRRHHSAEQQATAKAIADNSQLVGHVIDKWLTDKKQKAEARAADRPDENTLFGTQTFVKQPTPANNQINLF